MTDMLYRVHLNSFEKEVFEYALHSSRFIGICTYKKSGRVQMLPEYARFFERMAPFAVQNEKFEWAPYQHYRSGQSMGFFSLVPESIKLLSDFPGSFFGAEDACFPDISFYNGKQAWLYCIGHEEILYLRTDDAETVAKIESFGCRADLCR